MRIWKPLIYKYLVPAGASEMEREMAMGKLMMGELDGLWPLAKSQRLVRAERLVLAWSYDKAYVERERLAEMADLFEEFDRLRPAGGVNHLPRLAEIHRQAAALDDGWLGLCFHQMSVSQDPWHVVVNAEEDEERPYGASLDAGHWGLFAEYDVPESELTA